jgi:hypothetical protein
MRTQYQRTALRKGPTTLPGAETLGFIDQQGPLLRNRRLRIIWRQIDIRGLGKRALDRQQVRRLPMATRANELESGRGTAQQRKPLLNINHCKFRPFFAS